MARIARVIVPHYPHHITQRGSRSQTTFFHPADYQLYIDLLVEHKNKFNISIWAYCLMPNHVHLIITPENETGISHYLSHTHRNYVLKINKRNGWTGHLWQERFCSFVMDEIHLLAAVRYVELNPVRAALCKSAELWPWSSARAHLSGNDDQLVSVKPMQDRVKSWQEYLQDENDSAIIEVVRKHTKTGRPAGPKEFLVELEKLTGKKLRKSKRGRKPKLIC